MDVTEAELKKWEANVALAKSEVTVARARARAEVVVTQSEVAKAKMEERGSRRDGYKAALSDVQAAFPKLDLSNFGPLEGSQVEQ